VNLKSEISDLRSPEPAPVVLFGASGCAVHFKSEISDLKLPESRNNVLPAAGWCRQPITTPIPLGPQDFCVSDSGVEQRREGFERGTTNELLQFVYIARGSAGEVRSMLCLLGRRPWMREFATEISDLKAIAESCSRQLRGWAESLQNSPIQGPRHLTDQSKRQFDAKRRAEECQKQLLRNLPKDHPMRRDAEERGLI
jgi:hypothetical protein